MRYAIALVTAVLLGFGAKLFFFSAPAAVADVPAATINTSEIQQHITDVPVYKYHDMSFVYSEAN